MPFPKGFQLTVVFKFLEPVRRMHNRADPFAKNILRDALSPRLLLRPSP